MYLYPCKTGGKCRQLTFEHWGLKWSDAYPKFGGINVTTMSANDIPVYRGRYKCCTQCHAPLNQVEATKANKFYGYKLEDVTFDNEFMELLDGI